MSSRYGDDEQSSLAKVPPLIHPTSLSFGGQNLIPDVEKLTGFR